MKYVSFIFKYLIIGCLLGVGILFADDIYYKYGTPQRVLALQNHIDRLNAEISDLFQMTGLGGQYSVSFRVFGKRLMLEESCELYLDQWPGIACDDYPHITTASLSERYVDLDEEIEMLERIAVEGTLHDKEVDGLRAITWTTDQEKLQDVFREESSRPVPKTKPTVSSSVDLPQSYTAIVCSRDECLRIHSGSLNKVEGLVAQILSE